MKKFAFAAIFTFALVGVVTADDIMCTITKVDGNKITYKTGKKGEEQKVATAEATADCKVVNGKKDMNGVMAGDAIDKGLKNEMFSSISDKGIKGQVTTNAAGKITQVMVLKGKKGGE